MDYAQRDGDDWRLLVPGENVSHEDLIVGYGTILVWSDEDRAEWEIETVREAAPIPAGKRSVAQRLVDHDGHPVFEHELEDVPAPAAEDVFALVDAEKDRRVADGFAFKGKLIQSRPEDRENILGAHAAAQSAKLAGAAEEDFGWQQLIDPVGGAPMFAWITADNTLLPLDADDTIAMGYAAMFHKQRLIFDARSIKERIERGQNVGDITRDELWSA